MTNLSILGTGNMGQAIAAVAAKGGHSVQQLGANDLGTPVSGDIVVLAVPYPAVADVIATSSTASRRVPTSVKKPSPDCSRLLFEMPSIVMLIVFCGRPEIVDERAEPDPPTVVTPGMKMRKFSAVRSLRGSV